MSKNLSGDLLYEILGNYDANKLSNDNHEYLNSNEYLIGKYLEKALKDKDSNFKYYFTCGIAGELAPDDPVIIVHEIIYDKDGKEVSRDKSDQIYGRTSIEEWKKISNTDPINRKPILEFEPVQSERSEKLSECFVEYRNKLSDKEQEEVNKAIDDILNKKLIEAAKKDDLSIMRQYLNNGADVNAKDINGYTPLLYYAYRSTGRFSNPETAKYLIDKGADINAKNNYGDTPLLLALYNNRIELAKYLIDKGADVNAKNNNGRTPLLRAVCLDNKELAKYLIDKGADVNAKDINGYTPLFHAIGNIELVKHIIGKGVHDINARTNYGDTTLLFAVLKNDTESVKYLIDKGADVTAKNEKGETPLDIAKRVLQKL